MGRQVCLTMPSRPQPMHHTKRTPVSPETTRLFTQLWASLQSGEADGGVS